eukprot:TRINITY_DN17712_c0_g1_i1.p2 TRINITY_DN17712_c0_g1~~TRINITY_DN17712_c0_g1_i1.p2  ORF type:complete len:122 (+),score=48.17 TRINITY_DN17712_c0_g1_i1:40-366(+)
MNSMNPPSLVSGLKDQMVGEIKEIVGHTLGKEELITEGRAMSLHGKIEFQAAKAEKKSRKETNEKEESEILKIVESAKLDTPPQTKLSNSNKDESDHKSTTDEKEGKD